MAAPPLPSFVSLTETWHDKPYPFISPTRPALSATGKNVVITGGSSGIGQATAIAFAQANAKSVAIIGRRRDRLEQAASEVKAAGPATQVLYKVGDVAKSDSIDQALRSVVQQVGNIDIFICNAGTLPKEGSVVGYDEAELRRGLDTIVLGSFNSLQTFRTLAAPGAKLFNTGSGIGHWAPLPEVPGVFAYAAAKSAALKMFDYFGAENPDIHVVSVQPGIIATELNADMSTNVGFDTGIVLQPLIMFVFIANNQPVELPAHFFVWLASEEATFLKGKFVWANWDAEELIVKSDEIQQTKLLTVGLSGVDV